MAENEEKTIDIEQSKEDKKSLDEANKALMEAYKTGYLDGMIVGLYAADVDSIDISEYLNVPTDYVNEEILYFSERCRRSGGKIKDKIDLNKNDKN